MNININWDLTFGGRPKSRPQKAKLIIMENGKAEIYFGNLEASLALYDGFIYGVDVDNKVLAIRAFDKEKDYSTSKRKTSEGIVKMTVQTIIRLMGYNSKQHIGSYYLDIHYENNMAYVIIKF